MLYTTGALAKRAGACQESYAKISEALGGRKYGVHTLIPLTKIIEITGLDDAIWALKCCTDQPAADKLARIFACDCAWMVLPIYEAKCPNDTRVRDCIEVARNFALREATKEELSAAGAAAWAAARAAARAAAGDTAWAAAGTAARAAADTAGDTAWAAAGTAAWAAAWTAAWAAAWAVAGTAERDWQRQHLIKLLEAR